MYRVDKAVVMARKHRLNETAKLILDQAHRIKSLEARIAKADALAASLEAYNRGGAGPLTGWLDVEEALAAYREGSDT